MNPDIIVQLILKKGLRNVNISMFTEEERHVILEKAAEMYLRIGKKDAFLEIIEQIDVKKSAEIMKQMADQYFELKEYEKAALIYEKIGDKNMSTIIRENFLK